MEAIDSDIHDVLSNGLYWILSIIRLRIRSGNRRDDEKGIYRSMKGDSTCKEMDECKNDGKLILAFHYILYIFSIETDH